MKSANPIKSKFLVSTIVWIRQFSSAFSVQLNWFNWTSILNYYIWRFLFLWLNVEFPHRSNSVAPFEPFGKPENQKYKCGRFGKAVIAALPINRMLKRVFSKECVPHKWKAINYEREESSRLRSLALTWSELQFSSHFRKTRSLPEERALNTAIRLRV